MICFSLNHPCTRNCSSSSVLAKLYNKRFSGRDDKCISVATISDKSTHRSRMLITEYISSPKARTKAHTLCFVLDASIVDSKVDRSVACMVGISASDVRSQSMDGFQCDVLRAHTKVVPIDKECSSNLIQ